MKTFMMLALILIRLRLREMFCFVKIHNLAIDNSPNQDYTSPPKGYKNLYNPGGATSF